MRLTNTHKHFGLMLLLGIAAWLFAYVGKAQWLGWFQRLFMRRDGVISHLMKTHERVFVLVFRCYGEKFLALVLFFAVPNSAPVVATIRHNCCPVEYSIRVVKIRDNLP